MMILLAVRKFGSGLFEHFSSLSKLLWDSSWSLMIPFKCGRSSRDLHLWPEISLLSRAMFASNFTISLFWMIRAMNEEQAASDRACKFIKGFCHKDWMGRVGIEPARLVPIARLYTQHWAAYALLHAFPPSHPPRYWGFVAIVAANGKEWPQVENY